MSISFFTKTRVRLLSLFLCFVLCFTIISLPAVQPPAHAEVVALTATTLMVAAAIAMITSLGVTFVKTGDAQKAAEAFVNSSTEVHDLFADLVDNIHSGGSPNGGNGDGTNKLKLNAACTAGLAVLISKAKDFFKIGTVSQSNVLVNSGDTQTIGNISFTTLPLSSLNSAAVVSSFCPYPFNTFKISTNPLTFVRNGITFYIGSDEDGALCYYTSADSSRKRFTFYEQGRYLDIKATVMNSISYTYLASYQSQRFGFRLNTDTSGNKYLLPMIFIDYIKTDGSLATFYRVPECFNGTNGIPISNTSITPVKVPVPYTVSSPYSTSDIYSSLRDKLSVITDPVVTTPPIVSPETSGSPAPSESPAASPVISPMIIDIEHILEQIEANQNKQLEETQKDILIDIGIKDALDDKKSSGNDTPETPTKPGLIPDIGSLWDYVKNFLSKALIWMQLWYSGFVLLPVPLQMTLWALLVITIILGVLGVILR